jgi:hypothetical protein
MKLSEGRHKDWSFAQTKLPRVSHDRIYNVFLSAGSLTRHGDSPPALKSHEVVLFELQVAFVV